MQPASVSPSTFRTTEENHHVIRPGAEERAQFVRLSRLLEDSMADRGEQAGEGLGSHERVTLDFPSHETVELPRSAVVALLEISRALAEGQTVRLVPHGTDLTTQAAADLLGVSRPHLIALIDRGELTCHKVGTHRRLVSDEVLAYRERRNAARRADVQELQRVSAALEGDY